MNIPPAAVAAIRSEVPDWSPSDAAIAAMLNTPSIVNPAARATVPTPFAISQLSAQLDATAMTNLLECPSFPTIVAAINANDVPACNLWAATLEAAGKITQAQYQGMAAIINATGPDPAYQPQISWAVANLGRPVTPADVAAARVQS